MSATKLDPLALVGTTLFDDLNRLFDGPRSGRGIVNEGWRPRIDVAESAEAFLIRAELPGVEPDSIDVTVVENVLAITGTRSFDAKDGDAAAVTYRRREIVAGEFLRKIRLHGEVDIDAVTATSSNGILEITVPKQSAELPRKVTVAVQR